MLIIPEKSEVGNILHIIAGPETDLFMDMYGSKMLDLKPVLAEFEPGAPVYLSLTRCKSEKVTETVLKEAGQKCYNSFTSPLSRPRQAEKEATNDESSNQQLDEGKCSYCNQVVGLLPIPGMEICPVCAQIELRIKDAPSKE